MKIAVFGKPGGGKSTLAEEIARTAGLPLHQLDLLQFEIGGIRVSDEVFAVRQEKIIATDRWVVDGFGTARTFGELLSAADILVYIERPTIIHYWWVTKRLLMAPLRPPIGWPNKSPIVKSTIISYRFLRMSHHFWNATFRKRLIAFGEEKRVYVIRKQSDVTALLQELCLSPVGIRS